MSTLKGLLCLTAAALLAAAAATATAGTLENVKAKDQVHCGVNTGLPGFSFPDSQGKWTGLDVDLCRAIAAAVLGDANKTKFTPLTAQQRFTALQSGEIDVLVRNSTITLQRDAGLGIQHAGVNFYDGQAVVVPKATGVKSMTELKGAAICVAQGTTHEANLADWFRSRSIDIKPVVFESQDRMYDAFFGGRCDAMTQDSSALAAAISSVSGKPDAFLILPERISKEPLGPFVRKGDDKWLTVVRWVLMATIEAEELGITQTNVADKANSADPTIRRLLGTNAGNGKALDLDEKWAFNLIAQVGNYGDSYERNVGKASVLKLDRGPNALWTQGGLMYAIPLR